MLTYAVLLAIAASGWIGMAVVMVLGHLDEDKSAAAIAAALTGAEKAEQERDQAMQLWAAYVQALQTRKVELVFVCWADEMRRRAARLAEIERSDEAKTCALRMIADGCSRPAKVAAAALEAEQARSEDEEEVMAWVQ